LLDEGVNHCGFADARLAADEHNLALPVERSV
jgi:hypothetical protein